MHYSCTHILYGRRYNST